MPTTRSQDLAAREAPEKIEKPRAREKKAGKTAKATQASQTHLSSSIAQSPLFKLSPELRNMIYRFAIVTKNKVRIAKTRGIPEPALLSVSKTVRSETFGIFYSENKFLAVAERYDPAAILLTMRRLSVSDAAIGLTGIRGFALITDEDPNWNNLVKWLHLCLQEGCFGLGSYESDNAEAKLIAGLFETVYEDPTMSAVNLDILLKNIRPALVELDEDWAMN